MLGYLHLKICSASMYVYVAGLHIKEIDGNKSGRKSNGRKTMLIPFHIHQNL